MDQLICASLSHTHYWYEVGMLKVPAGVCIYGHHFIQSIDQPGKVDNPARGQLNTENEYFPVSVRALGIRSLETGSAVPSCVSLLILYTQA